MQAILVSFQNEAVDGLAASGNWILEITRTPNAEAHSVKEIILHKSAMLSFVILTFIIIVDALKLFSRPLKTASPDWYWYHNKYGKSSGDCMKPSDSQTPNTSTRKVESSRVNGNCSQRTQLFVEHRLYDDENSPSLL